MNTTSSNFKRFYSTKFKVKDHKLSTLIHNVFYIYKFGTLYLTLCTLYNMLSNKFGQLKLVAWANLIYTISTCTSIGKMYAIYSV